MYRHPFIRIGRRWFLPVGALLLLASCGGLCWFLTAGPAPRLVASLGPEPTPTAVPTPLPDSDHDGRPDSSDLCPEVHDPVPSDVDGDGWGDVCDFDIDGDGTSNASDACPFNDSKTCSSGEPQTVNIANTDVGSGAESPEVAHVGLTTFDPGDPLLPFLLNGTVHAAGDAALWDEAGEFILGLLIEWASAEAGVAQLEAAQLILSCPADMAGQCEGTIRFTLAGPAQVCADGDARCAWALNAANGDAGLVNVWGSYDPDENVVRFATGLPIHPGDAYTTRYSIKVQPAGGLSGAFGSPAGQAEFPRAFADPEGDCLDVDEQAAECEAMGDLRSAVLAFEWIEGAPFIVATFETGGDIPAASSGPRVIFDAFVFVQVDAEFTRLEFYEFTPTRGGQWQIRRLQEGEDGRFRQVSAPAGMTFSSEGNMATLHLPLSFTQPWTVGLHSVGTRVPLSGNARRTDSIRDNRFDATPLVFFTFPTDGTEGAAPLAQWPLYPSGSQAFHTFLTMPFPAP